MKISDIVKQAGFKTVKEFSKFVGVSPETLRNWYNDKEKRKTFNALIEGAKEIKNGSK